MAAEVVLIHRPAVDHAALKSLTQKIVNRNPEAILDAANRQFTDDAKALIRLLSFAVPEANNSLDALRTSQSVQTLLHYTFLVLATPGIFDEVVLLNTGLDYALVDGDFNKPIFVLGGALDVWRNAILTGCSETPTPDTRQLFNKLSLQFDRLGLSEVWHGYKRTPQKDGGFLMVRS